jgi:oligopeptide/dipeptide ABC transporter ATP-binding protein
MRAFPSFGRPLSAALTGEIPSPIDLPKGCRFASRCPRAEDECRRTDPALIPDGEGRQVACLFPINAAKQILTTAADGQPVPETE